MGNTIISNDVPKRTKSNLKQINMVKHAARVGSELVYCKTNYTGDQQVFEEVVEGALVPVVIAGGPKLIQIELLQMAKESVEVGGAE